MYGVIISCFVQIAGISGLFYILKTNILQYEHYFCSPSLYHHTLFIHLLHHRLQKLIRPIYTVFIGFFSKSACSVKV